MPFFVVFLTKPAHIERFVIIVMMCVNYILSIGSFASDSTNFTGLRN